MLIQQRCLCFGVLDNGGVATFHHRIIGDDLKKLQTYVKDIPGALKNNYDCAKYVIDNQSYCLNSINGIPDKCKIEDPTIPGYDDINLDQPIQYPKCFWNLSPYVDEWLGCVVDSKCGTAELCDGGNDLGGS